MSNTISRLSIEEDAWERKERSRAEEEQDKLDKEEVEKFKKLKTSSQLEENDPLIGGPCHQCGVGLPHQQINTRACGQSGQFTEGSKTEKETKTKSWRERY